MDAATLEGRLEFIRQAERLKDVLRSDAAPAAGRKARPSTAGVCA